MFDTYDGIWQPHDTTGVDFIFQFFADGRFAEEVVGGCCRQEGFWQYVPATDTLHLFYRVNGTYDADLLVRILTTDRLELQWMGRHGPVIERYRAR